MDRVNSTGEHDNGMSKKSPHKNPNPGETHSKGKPKGSKQSHQSGAERPRPVEIKSTMEALNAISDPQASKEWFVPRTNDHSARSYQVVDYQSEANRLTSYLGHWPEDSCVSPSELANAGLYYTGPGDRVRCAYCQCGLHSWTQGDTAIGEHIRHFPECQFIKSKMAELVSLPHGLTYSTNTKPSHDNLYDSSKKIVQDMGYSEELVRRAMEKLTLSKVKVSVDKLLDVVFELETEEECEPQLAEAEREEDEEDETAETAEEVNTPEQSLNNPLSEGQSLAKEYLEKGNDRRNSYLRDLRELEEENSILKGKTLCKICMDEEVNVLFLPCRHLVCCEGCGSMVKNCPVCRTLIVGTVNTYLA